MAKTLKKRPAIAEKYNLETTTPRLITEGTYKNWIEFNEVVSRKAAEYLNRSKLYIPLYFCGTDDEDKVQVIYKRYRYKKYEEYEN